MALSAIADKKKFSGAVLFFGAMQFLLFVSIAEFVATNFTVSGNTISHLGIDNAPYIFNTTIIILGLSEIIAGYFLRENFSKLFSIFLVIGGIGAIGVGIFNEDFGKIHLLFALLAFVFSSLGTYVIFFKKRKDLMTSMWAMLGTVALIALILYSLSIDLGLGKGGMERMIMYPNIIWAIGFSASLYYGKWD